MQPLNASRPKVLRERGRVTEVSAVHLENALGPISVKVPGSVREVIPQQLWNAEASILFTEFGSMMDLRLLHSAGGGGGGGLSHGRIGISPHGGLRSLEDFQRTPPFADPGIGIFLA